MSQLGRWPSGATAGQPGSAGPSIILTPARVDPPPFTDPTSIPGLTWWDGTALGLTDGAPVGTITDTSGNAGGSLTQAVAGQQPIFHTNLRNGYSGLQFDHASSQSMSSTVSADATTTLFLVVQHAGIAGDKYALGGVQNIDGNGATWYYYPNQAGGVTAFGGIDPTRPQILCLRNNSLSSTDAFVDRNAATSLDPDDSYATSTGLYIGQNGGGGQYFDGYVFEVLRYDSALSETDRQNVRDWLWSKYALGTLSRLASDALGTLDSASRAVSLFRVSLDSLGTTDTAGRASGTRARASIDALGTIESATRTAQRARSAADALGTIESATRTAQRARSAADGLNTLDAASRFALLLTRSSADTLGTFDSASGFAGKRFGVDTLGTVDAVVQKLLASRAAFDVLGTADSAARFVALTKAAQDSLGTIDAATRAALLRARTTSDALGTADAATRSFLLRARAGADVLGTADTASRLRTTMRATVDSLGTSDFVARFLVGPRGAADSLGTADVVNRLVFLRHAAGDVLGTVDVATAILDFVVAPDLLGPLHVLVLSNGVLTDVLTLQYVAKADAFESASKTMPNEPHQQIDILDALSEVELLDYIGKVT